MEGGAQTKSALLRERRAIRAYQAVLPALDMKRKALTAARAAEKRKRDALEAQAAALAASVAARLPMLSDESVSLATLVSLAAVRRSEENLVGVALLRVDAVEFHARVPGTFIAPPWAAAAAATAQEVTTLALAIQNASARISRLDKAIAKAAQRVNLLEKVLLPRARARVSAISQRLADLERANVVIAKIAKAKRAKAMDR